MQFEPIIETLEDHTCPLSFLSKNNFFNSIRLFKLKDLA